MIVVIDTNTLLACIPKQAKTRWLFDALRRGAFRFAYSTEILEEYEEVLGAYYAPEVAENVIALLINQPNRIETNVVYRWNLITDDPDDNKFIDCGVAAHARYVITRDRHFRVLDDLGFPPIKRISPEEFGKVLGR